MNKKDNFKSRYCLSRWSALLCVFRISRNKTRKIIWKSIHGTQSSHTVMKFEKKPNELSAFEQNLDCKQTVILNNVRFAICK